MFFSSPSYVMDHVFKKEPVQFSVLELSEFGTFTPKILTEWKALGNFLFFQ